MSCNWWPRMIGIPAGAVFLVALLGLGLVSIRWSISFGSVDTAAAGSDDVCGEGVGLLLGEAGHDGDEEFAFGREGPGPDHARRIWLWDEAGDLAWLLESEARSC